MEHQRLQVMSVTFGLYSISSDLLFSTRPAESALARNIGNPIVQCGASSYTPMATSTGKRINRSE